MRRKCKALSCIDCHLSRRRVPQEAPPIADMPHLVVDRGTFERRDQFPTSSMTRLLPELSGERGELGAERNAVARAVADGVRSGRDVGPGVFEVSRVSSDSCQA